MKSKSLLNKFSKGFTLIELLVVIAVLGIVSAAFLAAINPIGKINQAKDATVKSDMGQLVNALQAYYTGQASPTYPAALSTLTTATPAELKSLPKQQTGNLGCVTATGADATDYCYTAAAGQTVAVWGALFGPATRSFYCWDSGTGTYKTSVSAAAGQTTCP